MMQTPKRKDRGTSDFPERFNSKLSWADTANVLRLEATGKSQRDIATFDGVNQATISRIVSAFGTTRGKSRTAN